MRVEDASRIVKRPYVTEKTFNMVERENKLVFIVDEKANKRAIKQAIEILYEVKVESVNTTKTIYGKKAYVKLSKENPATDLAAKLGIV
ncbi:MAG: 50S ribosomal protein L23 [archaeon]|nr:50S ribosomal protein L23 [archaeon]MCP8306464.1 50S ribosomal protein L23 [archaeon]